MLAVLTKYAMRLELRSTADGEHLLHSAGLLGIVSSDLAGLPVISISTFDNQLPGDLDEFQARLLASISANTAIVASLRITAGDQFNQLSEWADHATRQYKLSTNIVYAWPGRGNLVTLELSELLELGCCQIIPVSRGVVLSIP